MARHADVEQRREAIAHAVWQVAVADGLPGITIRRVATAAGISAGQVQHYFATRDDLVVFAAQQMVQCAVTHYPPDTALTRRPRSQVSTEQLHEDLVSAVAHVLQGEPAGSGLALWYSFVAESVANPRVAAILRTAKQGQEDYAAALLAAWPTGAPRDPRRSARDLVALSDGLALRVHLGSLDATDALACVHRWIDESTSADLIGPVNNAGQL